MSIIELLYISFVIIGVSSFLIFGSLKRYNLIRQTQGSAPLYLVAGLVAPLASIFVSYLLVFVAEVPMAMRLVGVTGLFAICVINFYLLDGLIEFFDDKERKTELKRFGVLVELMKLEQRSMEEYVSRVEEDNIEIRKFRHDFQNIMTSLSLYIEDGNLEQLREYYRLNFEAASELIAKSEFVISDLANIRVSEIKCILAAKLLDAQNLNIETLVEATSIIESVPVDTFSLVRMLGIIMDNAIEELSHHDDGKLAVACFEQDDGVSFIVQNSCRSDTPPLHILKRVGFSTKGRGRGLGLNNLSELSSSMENVTLQTIIEGGYFTQKIWVGNPE